MDVSRRAWRADLAADTEGRVISGVAVPWDSPTMIAERGRVFEERFAPGAFDDSIAKRGDRIPILLMHDDRALPVGKAVGFKNDRNGQVLEARISDTTDGNDALTLVRDGVLSGLSVGFSVPEGGDSWSADYTQRTVNRATLHEVSIVNFPAYDDARISSVRAAQEVPVVEEVRTEASDSAAFLLRLWSKRA